MTTPKTDAPNKAVAKLSEELEAVSVELDEAVVARDAIIEKRNDLIRKLINAGLTTSQVATLARVNAQRVSQIVHGLYSR